jgi:branched-chain amino acid transport system permease protein
MLQYVIIGLALGSIYAIASSSIVVTFVSTGTLNFAFGAMAYVSARCFYWLNSQHHVSTALAGIVCVLVVAPVLGVALWALVFRRLGQQSTVIRVVATVGLSIALVPLADVTFGTVAISKAPGLAGSPVPYYRFLGTVITLDQIIVYVALILVATSGVLILKRTAIGLRVRAMVDSEALTSLSGTTTNRISCGVWAVTTSLAGLCGVLVAPLGGLSIASMTALMTSSFAAVVAARLRSLPMAVVISLLLGLVASLLQYWLPPSGLLTALLLPSVPFIVLVSFLVIYVLLRQPVDENLGVGGVLDRAVRPSSGTARSSPPSQVPIARPVRAIAPVVLMIAVVLLPILLNGYWLGLVAGGFALGIAFLSFTLVTGEGGMIWLCQITFAGAGAIGSAQLVTAYGWAPLPAVLVFAVAVVPVGIVISVLTTNLGDLYVAIATLSFAIVMGTVVFTRDPFYNFGAGVSIARPSFALGDRSFAYLSLATFAVIAIALLNLRRSTTGLALSAVRWSPAAAKTLDLSTVKTKVLASAVATYIAAVGGGFIAMSNGSAIPDSYVAYAGLIWLAVYVTLGVRSLWAALFAGLTFTLVPGLFGAYLPSSWSNLPTILFGVGAVLVVNNPDGVVATYGRQFQALLVMLARGRRPARPLPEPPAPLPTSTEVLAAVADRWAAS